jgi:hypothetical protein
MYINSSSLIKRLFDECANICYGFRQMKSGNRRITAKLSPKPRAIKERIVLPKKVVSAISAKLSPPIEEDRHGAPRYMNYAFLSKKPTVNDALEPEPRQSSRPHYTPQSRPPPPRRPPPYLPPSPDIRIDHHRIYHDDHRRDKYFLYDGVTIPPIPFLPPPMPYVNRYRDDYHYDHRDDRDRHNRHYHSSSTHYRRDSPPPFSGNVHYESRERNERKRKSHERSPSPPKKRKDDKVEDGEIVKKPPVADNGSTPTKKTAEEPKKVETLEKIEKPMKTNKKKSESKDDTVTIDILEEQVDYGDSPIPSGSESDSDSVSSESPDTDMVDCLQMGFTKLMELIDVDCQPSNDRAELQSNYLSVNWKDPNAVIPNLKMLSESVSPIVCQLDKERQFALLGWSNTNESTKGQDLLINIGNKCNSVFLDMNLQ